MDDRAHLLALRDDAIPVLPELLGPGTEELLAAALPNATTNANSTPSGITWRPGYSIAVRYDLRVTDLASTREVTVVAQAGARQPEGGLVLGNGDNRVTLFALPGDPSLPGLAIARTTDGARELLDCVSAAPGPVTTAIRAYRPGRRAVIEAKTDGFRAFIKVVRPAAIAALQEKHRALAEALPVPRSHGWDPANGLVVLEALPGRTLRDTLGRGELVPPPHALAALLDRIPPLDGAPIRPGPMASAPTHAQLIGLAVPALRAPLESLLANLAGASSDRDHPVVPVHGDFHGAQVLVRDGQVSGLLDIDTVAVGHRINDWAGLVGQLAIWAPASANPAYVQSYARDLLVFADRDTGDPAGLRLRIAAVIIGLATGPFRVQMRNWVAETHRRVALAEQWAESARPRFPQLQPLCNVCCDIGDAPVSHHRQPWVQPSHERLPFREHPLDWSPHDG